VDFILFWLYLITASLLIVHEIDSAYWQEWKLFKLPGGLGTFLVLHIPLVALILWGQLMVYTATWSGRVLALLLACCGLFAFVFHSIHLRRGKQEFRHPVSKLVLWLLLFSSTPLFVMALYSMMH